MKGDNGDEPKTVFVGHPPHLQPSPYPLLLHGRPTKKARVLLHVERSLFKGEGRLWFVKWQMVYTLRER